MTLFVLMLKIVIVVGIACAHHTALDREGADARKHVAAIGRRIDGLPADCDLREKVIDIDAWTLGAVSE
jgi:hypothetical protein